MLFSNLVDVAAVKLGSNSSTIWNISPPDKDRLLDDLKSSKIYIKYLF